MPVYKNAVLTLSGGEKVDAASRTVDCTVAFTVEMPTWDIEFDQPGNGAGISIKAPEGFEIGTAEVAEDYSYVSISFVPADGGGGGGGED